MTINGAVELPACRCTAGLFAEGEQLSHWQTRHQTAHSNRRPTLQERTMTDRDEIKLPPLPARTLTVHSDADLMDYARAAAASKSTAPLFDAA